jgi:hypothetical protein
MKRTIDETSGEMVRVTNFKVPEVKVLRIIKRGDEMAANAKVMRSTQ